MTGTPWYGCCSRWNARRPRPTAPASQPFIPFLLATAAADRDHVLVRQSTRNALLSLHAAGLVALDPPALSGAGGRQQASRTAARTQPGHVRPGPQRRSPQVLLRLRQVLVLRACRGVRPVRPGRESGWPATSPTAEWDFSPGAKAEEDERRNRGLYREDSTWAHGSEWPKEDDLGRYLGFHALMTVAGRLIRQRPVYSGELGRGQPVRQVAAGLPAKPPGRAMAGRPAGRRAPPGTPAPPGRPGTGRALGTEPDRRQLRGLPVGRRRVGNGMGRLHRAALRPEPGHPDPLRAGRHPTQPRPGRSAADRRFLL